MCSKAPVVGMVPQRLLLETSLNQQMMKKTKLIMQQKHDKLRCIEIERKTRLWTYTTLRLEISASTRGIWPDNLLLLSRLDKKTMALCSQQKIVLPKPKIAAS